MKVAIVLLAVAVSYVSAGGYGAAPAAYGTVSTGLSSQFRSQDNYGNYKFGYDLTTGYGSSGRHEERHGNAVHGSYNLADADGRQRTVNYIADGSGFRAAIHTNEPGVEGARDPADVLINKEGYATANPAPVYAAAPIVSAPVYQDAAPITYETPAPRAFSYSFGAAHPSQSYGTPAYQEKLGY